MKIPQRDKGVSRGLCLQSCERQHLSPAASRDEPSPRKAGAGNTHLARDAVPLCAFCNLSLAQEGNSLL